MAIREVLTAPRSPWQSPCVERLIGSIRRECLDHIMVFNEASLRRTSRSYFQYCGHSRTHLPLAKDAPVERAVQPPELGPAMGSADCTLGTNDGPLNRRFSLLAVCPLVGETVPPRIGPQ